MLSNKQNHKKARRRILTTLVVGGVVEATPAKWTKPIIDTVVLPAHAQVSPIAPSLLSCNAGSLTVDNTGPASDGHVAIIYNGSSSCSLLQTLGNIGGDSGDPDEMLLLDADNNPVTDFDLNGPTYGANWGPGPNQADNAAGSYSFNIQRTAAPNSGTTFRVSFNVSFAGNNMTVSNVQINEV